VTRATNARVAGFTFLFYIVAGILSLVVFGRAASGAGIAARLASMAQHVTEVRLVVILGLIQSFCAIVLAVTLYSITREEDADLAMLGLTFRVGEGLVGIAIPSTQTLLWLATATGPDALDTASAQALAAFLLKGESWTSLTSAMFFAVGSTFFSWLLLRGRMIPNALAWIGVFASVLLVALLPLQLSGWLTGPITSFMWLPMLAFEVPLALWLLIKGVARKTT
jgi:hypothetical protein